MKNNSYLLALDGSVESKAAAYVAWQLAKKTGARLVAQHVVNIRDTWRFLRPKSAGLIGSGPYIEAFEHVTEGQRSVAEALMESYRTQAAGQNIDFATYIDEGDVVSEITKRTREHDLLIIGHRKINEKQNGEYSLCEELANFSYCPILIVTSDCSHWKKLRINIENTKIDLAAVEKLSKFGQSIGLLMQLNISSSIPTANLQSLLSVLPLCPGSKSWDIYMEGDSSEIHDDELPVIMPTLTRSGSSVRTNLKTEINKMSQPATLVWLPTSRVMAPVGISI